MYDLAAGHAAVHPARHLEDLVGAEVEPVEHVAAPLDDVAVAGVVDHHGIEPADVERRLAGRGHREQEGLRDLALEERADDPDRLAAVVERGVEPGPALAQAAGQLLHLGPGRHEDRHAASFLDDVPDEALVEELVGLAAARTWTRALERRIERLGLQHLVAVEVPGVERRDRPWR